MQILIIALFIVGSACTSSPGLTSANHSMLIACGDDMACFDAVSAALEVPE